MVETGSRLVVRAPAKVNLSLRILGRRADGYHDIDSLVAFADLHDRLEIEVLADGPDRLTVRGPFADRIDGENLVLRALAAVRKRIGAVPPLSVLVTKNIPVAAGLGGGSADAAAAIRASTRLAGHEPRLADLISLAASLGADVPVCLESRARVMRGIGADLLPPLELPELPILLANPLVAVPTAEVFRRLRLDGAVPRHDLEVPIDRLLRDGPNDLEAAAVSVAPAIAHLLAWMRRRAGVVACRLSGSGATCFALFEDAAAAAASAEALRGEQPDVWLHLGRLTAWNEAALFD